MPLLRTAALSLRVPRVLAAPLIRTALSNSFRMWARQVWTRRVKLAWSLAVVRPRSCPTRKHTAAILAEPCTASHTPGLGLRGRDTEVSPGQRLREMLGLPAFREAFFWLPGERRQLRGGGWVGVAAGLPGDIQPGLVLSLEGDRH